MIVTSSGTMSHQGITLEVTGAVTLQLSGKNVGIMEAFYSSLEPIKLIDLNFQLVPPGKLPNGVSELPFEFKLEPAKGQKL